MRPGDPEHVIVKKYLEPFHQLIHLDDIDVSELVVWTTRYRAEMVGKYEPESACMQARITEAIRADVLDEMSGGGTAVASSVVLAGQSCDIGSATQVAMACHRPDDGLVEARVVTAGMPQNAVAAAATVVRISC